MDTLTIENAKRIISNHPNSVLVTIDESEQLRDRMMWTAKIDDDMIVYYAASLKSPQVNRIKMNPNVLALWFGDSKYVSLRGFAEIISDKAVLYEIWKETFKTYFPNGKNDPDYIVIKVMPSRLVCVDNCDAAVDVIDLH
ncbi:MAG: pyridoxamine 5'-phosphate oxidase family protein [Armatimonadota bacterium]